MWYCLFVCWVLGWKVGYVCVVSDIGSCGFECSAWGLSSAARSDDFVFCYLSGWMCGLVTGFRV